MRILETADLIWLYGEASTQNQKNEVDICLQQISGAVRFDRLPDGQLIQTGHTLPSCCLPEQPDTDWVLLTDWITFDLPQASLVGLADKTTTIEIVRQPLPKSTDEMREPSILRCSIKAFAAWADGASEHRIRRLSFACNQGGDVILRGTPLPSIRGKVYIDYGEIAVEAGYSWAPAVSINTLKQILDGSDSQLLICESDEPWQAIDMDNFVAATRVGIRSTHRQHNSSQETMP